MASGEVQSTALKPVQLDARKIILDFTRFMLDPATYENWKMENPTSNISFENIVTGKTNRVNADELAIVLDEGLLNTVQLDKVKVIIFTKQLETFLRLWNLFSLLEDDLFLFIKFV